MFHGLITHRCKAEGPITEARNADTTPEPLPTSTHTAGLHAQEENWFNQSTQLHKDNTPKAKFCELIEPQLL